MLSVNPLFGFDFRFRVIPFWRERPIFIDWFARFGWRMHQLGAGKDELLNLEMLQFAQHPLGPTDGDLFVQRTRLARERIIGGEMNHRGNTISVAITNPLEG